MKGSENPPLSPFSKGEGVVARFRQVMISQMPCKEKLFLDRSEIQYLLTFKTRYLYGKSIKEQ
jgi:hypothetical protein